MRVTILDDGKGEKCAARCGMDWSAAETIALARQRIKDRFGEGIELEYFELSEPANNYSAQGLTREIVNKNLPLPSLVINGVPRISGQFDIRQLLDVIEAEVEIDNKQRI